MTSIEKPPRIACPQCNGCGRVPLHPALAEVLALCTAEWQATKAINASLRLLKPTALVNRLQNLARLGLVESRFDPANAKRLEWRKADPWPPSRKWEG